MNNALYHRLREKGWRRKLSPGEQAELRALLQGDCERQGEMEIEARLTEALNRLPEVPVPSNFTTRVLRAVELQVPDSAGRRKSKWFWGSLLPKAAFVAMVVGLGVFSYERHEATQRARLARNVAALSSVAVVPNPDIFKDFDAIRRLSQTPPPDEELLALLK